MKNKFTLVYTIFASLIFAFSITFLAFNLYKEYSYGPARTSSTFNSIISDVRNKSKTSSPEEIVGYLHKCFDRYNDFAYIKISFNDKELLKYPANAVESSTGSKLTKKFKSSISTDNGSFYLDCDLYLLRPYSIFYYSKISFLIILIMTIITVILIVYLNMSSEISKSSSVDLELDTEPELEHVDTTEEIVQISKPEVPAEKIEVKPVVETPVSEEPAVEAAEPSVSEESVRETLETSEIPAEEKTDTDEKVVLPSEEEKPSQLENPEGLFNPITGFGWEQYLLTRLDSEINRAIASEIDISLFVIQLPGLEKTSDIFKNICNYLSIQFQFKDLLFEYKEDCLTAMKISMNIDEALSFADKIYFDIKNIIQDKECFIGISSRSIRMVSGERLLHEADNALIHAKEDPDSPIIAFRVDAEKYRQYLEQHN